jgi:ketosteroid isomerase-like protein
MSNAERLIAVLEPSFPTAEQEVDEALIDRIVAAIAGLADDHITGAMHGGANFTATYEGLDGLREAWRDWLETFARIRFEVEDVEEIGENVVTLARQIGTTRHGGVEIEQPSAAVWKFRDGRLVRIEFHLDRDEALASAGSTADPD